MQEPIEPIAGTTGSGASAVSGQGTTFPSYERPTRQALLAGLQNQIMTILAPQASYRLLGSAGQSVGARLYWTWQRRRDGFATRVIEELVHPGDHIVDIGASWGLYMWRLAHLVGPHGHIYAFEPNPANLGSLTALAAGRQHVSVYAVALSDRSGEATLSVPILGRHHISALSSLCLPQATHQGVTYEHIMVPTRRLDDVLGLGVTPISLIKCDVEGHELAVLHGAQSLLKQWLPSLVVEIEQRHSPHDIRETFAYLTDLGYVGYCLLEHGLKPVERFDCQRDQLDYIADGFKPYWMPQGYVNNFLFVRPDLPVAHLVCEASPV